ncbi:hypothetical protein D3C78_1484920 [compost metagenome]
MGAFIQRQLQRLQLQGAADGAVVTQADLAIERRYALGRGKPLFQFRALLQGIAAAGHYRHQLEGLQARQRERTMLDAVVDHPLQVARQLAALRPGELDAIARIAGEELAIQRQQFDRYIDAQGRQGLGHFVVGLLDRGFQRGW